MFDTSSPAYIESCREFLLKISLRMDLALSADRARKKHSHKNYLHSCCFRVPNEFHLTFALLKKMYIHLEKFDRHPVVQSGESISGKEWGRM